MRKYFWLIVITVLGIALRYYHNTDISLWHDEAFSALMIRYPWGEMFYRLGLDVHPPMYYIFLRFWHNVFGDSLLSLRSFSIFFSTASIWAAYALVKEAFKNKQAALWAALLIAINPFQLQYVTEARMYTFGAFFALLAGYFLVKALNIQKEKHDRERLNMPHLPEDAKLSHRLWVSYLGFTLSMIIIIYTHYYLFFTAAAIGFYGLVYLFFHHRWDWKKYIPLLLCFIIIVLSFLPWLKTFLFQYHQVQQSYWIPPLNVWSIPSTFWDMMLGFARDTTKTTTQFLLAIVIVASVGIFYRLSKKTDAFHKWLVVLAVVAPFCGSLLFALLARLKGSNSSVYLDRYFLFASVFFSIAMALWIKEISIRWLSASVLVIYCILNISAYAHYWNDLNVTTKPGMAKATHDLSGEIMPQDKLFVGSSFMFLNFKYYWTKYTYPGPDGPYDQDTFYTFLNHVRPRLYTGGVSKASDISHFAGSALLSDADLLPNFKDGAHAGDTVWVVWTNGFGASKPEVPTNWVQLDEKGYAEVRPYVGTWVIVTEYKVN
jgi:uncharacterized membrane protein